MVKHLLLFSVSKDVLVALLNIVDNREIRSIIEGKLDLLFYKEKAPRKKSKSVSRLDIQVVKRCQKGMDNLPIAEYRMIDRVFDKYKLEGTFDQKCKEFFKMVEKDRLIRKITN